MKRTLLVSLVLFLLGCSSDQPRPPAADKQPQAAAPGAADNEPSPAQQVFERRLLPIFRSPNPSSCVQCHLAGVDLRDYILPSHEKTFLSLRDQGLIDLDKPEKSKILALIQMGEADRATAALVHQKVWQAEYEAFAEWIKQSAADPRLRKLPGLTKASGPSRNVRRRSSAMLATIGFWSHSRTRSGPCVSAA
jgi:hypothetical protein